MSTPKSDIPEFLKEVREDFHTLPPENQLDLLLEFSDSLPELPPEFQGRDDLFERVIECQSPVFIHVDTSDITSVKIYATAPAESPTTRGFASILVQGLSGLSATEILDVDDDYPHTLGITDTVSPLRLRGMSGMIYRIKHQISQKHPKA